MCRSHLGCASFPYSRVEPAIQEVREKVGYQHANSCKQEERLHQWIVAVGHRLVQQPAQTWIAKDGFDENHNAHDAAERNGEARDIRQNRVARTVEQSNLPGLQT